MGGLFSSEPKQSSQQNSIRITPSAPSIPRRTNTAPTYSYSYSTNPQSKYASSSYQRPPIVTQVEPKCSGVTRILAPHRPLAQAVFRCPDTHSWDSGYVEQSPVYTLVQLNEDSVEYIDVARKFQRTAQKQMNVVKIQRVENPFLMGFYILKKEELQKKHGVNAIKEINSFHGTKQCNINSICNNNFDWRMHGVSLGNRFGQGISFSPIATYSSHYCDKCPKRARFDDIVKTMILVRVLVSQIIAGSPDMIIPPLDYDTAQKHDGKVIVKFNDNEFYPQYIIHFTGSAIKYIKPV